MIVISRFILNLLRSDQRDRPLESRYSHFAAAYDIHLPAGGGFGGEMGLPLDHGLRDSVQLNRSHTVDVVARAHSRADVDAADPSSEFAVVMDAGGPQ